MQQIKFPCRHQPLCLVRTDKQYQLPIRKWLLALPETCRELRLLRRQCSALSGTVRYSLRSVSRVFRQIFGKSCRESVRGWERKWAGWEEVPSLLHLCISSVLRSPSKMKLGCYSRDFLVCESLSSRFPLSHRTAAVGSILLFAQSFFFMS